MAQPAEPATLVLRGGAVHTMDAARSVGDAIAIRDTRIVAVGEAALVDAFIGADTEVIELGGRMILPGFIDAHAHLVSGSLQLDECNLKAKPLTIDQISGKVRDCVQQDPPAGADDWFEVFQVNVSGGPMTRQDLDPMLANSPLLLHGSDDHTAWANTRALELAGIDESTPDPPNGEIDRDAAGEPTGMLTDSARNLVLTAIPSPAPDEVIEKAQQGVAQFNAAGITSIQDALATPAILDAYAALEAAGALTLRVRAVLASRVVNDEAEYARLAGLREQYATGHPRIRADSVKIFADGVAEFPTQTAAMLEPYLDQSGQPSDNFGGHFFEQSVLNDYIARLDHDGFTVHVHSIGDAMARGALDAFEHAREQNGPNDHRHQLAHLQFVNPTDFSRFAELGVVANMQLSRAQPFEDTELVLQQYLDASTFRFMYPAESLVNAGALLAGGSDWPRNTKNPLDAIETGVTRANDSDQVLTLEERVTLDDMLAAYTINAARALQQEHTTGSLEVGKQADIVVLSTDITLGAPDQIGDASVRLTLFDGERVYDTL